MTEETCVRTANVARIYDYLLGGKDNFEVDRVAAERVLTMIPDAAVAAWDNRRFLGRAVDFLVREAGVRQFVDIGTGLPTRGNVHAIAHRGAAESRIAYIDNDPMVIAHANMLLNNHPNVAVVCADLRDPDGIIANPELRRLIKLDEPVAILLVAVLHFIRDSENRAGIVGRLKSSMPAGSYLVVSHVTDDQVPQETAGLVRELYEETSAPGVTRCRRAIAEFFDGLEMIPPGLVNVAQWRPDSGLIAEPGRTIFYAGVGIRR
jgi:O-methyltransferase involved in polyketide biosynthesis